MIPVSDKGTHILLLLFPGMEVPNDISNVSFYVRK